MTDQEKKVFEQQVSKEELKAVTGGYVDFDVRTDLIPVRPGRSAPRKLKPQSAKTFLYRAA